MKTSLLTVLVVSLCFVVSAGAAERHMMQPRVPADKLAEARALKSPLPDSPEIVEKGEALFEGKGTCFNCHGMDGGGNGPAAAQLNPSPRNFQHHGFWRHRTEGEIFWVIKNGSPGTAMIAFGPVLSDEEIWSLIQYERTFAGGHGPGMRGHREGMGPGGDMGGREGMRRGGPMMGQHGMMGGMGHGGPKGETGGCEGDGCGQ